MQRLATSHAYHTPQLAGMVEAYVAAVAAVRREAPQVPYVSTVTGTWATAAQVQPAGYWGEQILAPVQFARGVETVLGVGARVVVVEVGPGAGLSRLLRRRGGVWVCASLVSADEAGDLRRAAAELWTAGVPVDWNGLHGGGRRARVPLPTYPFQRVRYWIDPPAVPAAQRQTASSRPAPIRKRADVTEWFWAPSWTLDPQPPRPVRDRAGDRWLAFADREGLTSALAERLRREGAEVVVVSIGDGWSRPERDAFSIDATSGEHYARVAQTLAAEGRAVQHVLHCGSVTSPADVSDTSEDLERVQVTGLSSLLHAAHALNASTGHPLRTFAIVSSDAHLVESADRPHPAKAAAVAFATILAQETTVRTRCVDVAFADLAVSTALVAQQIVDTLDRETPRIVFACRGRRRWVASHERIDVSERGTAPFPLRDRGVYLITGGLGSVGLLIARQLAEACRARLVLTGRSGLPPRSQWSDRAARATFDAETLRRIDAILAIEAAGGLVRVAAADVTQRDDVRAAVALCDTECGGLDGVVHAAGVTSGPSLFRTIAETDAEHCRTQWLPKARGLYLLEEVIRERPVDFVLALSSNATVLGGLGFASYAAANAIMDAFALSRAARGGPTRWMSATWDHWPRETRKYQDVSTSMDEYAMTVEESRQAMRLVLTRCDRGQVIVSTGDLDARLKQWVLRDTGEAAPVATEAANTPDRRTSRPALRTPYVAPRNDLEARIAAVWGDFLGVETVGVNDDFFELGGHSLLAIKLMAEIGRAIGSEVPLRALLEGPTVGQLAAACAQPSAETAVIQ